MNKTFISVKKLLAAITLLIATSVHSAMWEDSSLLTPAQIDDFGFDVARHPDGRTFMARFENVDAGTPNIYLAQKSGPNSPWAHEDIRNTGLFNVKSLDLSVDNEGGLHLAFITKGFLLGTIVNLNYGYQAPGGDWTFEVVSEADPDLVDESNYAISLDLDSDDLPGIAYTAGDAALGFVRQSANGTWVNSLINNTQNSGRIPSLKFLSSPDEPIGILHYFLDGGGLTFTSFQTATQTWSADTIGVNTSYSFCPKCSSSLVEVSEGEPAIAFHNSRGSETVNYAVRQNGSWTAQLVDEGFPREQDDIFFGHQLSLTVDANHRPQITYVKGYLFDATLEAQEIRHARQLPNGLWANEVCVSFPENSNRNLQFFQLAADVDRFGNPIVVYSDEPEGEILRLRFTWPNGGIWNATLISDDISDDDIISAPSLTFGTDGTRVISAGIESGDFSFLTHWIKPVDEEQFTHRSFVESNLLATETVLGDEGRIDSVVSYPAGRFVNFSTQIQDGATLVSDETDVLFSNHKLSDLAIDHLGYRHLILEGDDGLEYFRAAPPLPFEPLIWENRTNQTPLTIGFSPSIAISPSGLLCFASTRTIEGDHYLRADYQMNNGRWGSYLFLNSPSPTRPSLAWLNNVPHLFFATYYAGDNRTSITVRNLLSEEENNFNVDGLVSALETVAHNDTLHVAWRSKYIFQGPGEPTHSGSRYLGYLAIGACPSNPQVVGALPYLEPQDGVARIDNVDLAVDPQGRPFIIANLRSDEGPDSLLLFEPAGDHSASPGGALELPAGLRENLVFTNEGNPVHEISFLHQAGQLPTIPPGSGYLNLGSSTLHSHYSPDLENESPAPEVILLSTIAEPGSPELERSTYQFSTPDVEGAPRLFYRLILKPACAIVQR